MSGGRDPVIPSLLRNKEAGGVKINISLIKIIIGFNKVKEEIKIFREIIFFFYSEFINSEWDCGWFPLACIYFGRGGKGKEEEEGGEEEKEEGKKKEKGVEGETGEVLGEGEEDEGKDEEKGRGGRGGK